MVEEYGGAMGRIYNDRNGTDINFRAYGKNVDSTMNAATLAASALVFPPLIGAALKLSPAAVAAMSVSTSGVLANAATGGAIGALGAMSDPKNNGHEIYDTALTSAGLASFLTPLSGAGGLLPRTLVGGFAGGALDYTNQVAQNNSFEVYDYYQGATAFAIGAGGVFLASRMSTPWADAGVKLPNNKINPFFYPLLAGVSERGVDFITEFTAASVFAAPNIFYNAWANDLFKNR